jgi:hypothetical protein
MEVLKLFGMENDASLYRQAISETDTNDEPRNCRKRNRTTSAADVASSFACAILFRYVLDIEAMDRLVSWEKRQWKGGELWYRNCTLKCELLGFETGTRVSLVIVDLMECEITICTDVCVERSCSFSLALDDVQP